METVDAGAWGQTRTSAPHLGDRWRGELFDRLDRIRELELPVRLDPIDLIQKVQLAEEEIVTRAGLDEGEVASSGESAASHPRRQVRPPIGVDEVCISARDEKRRQVAVGKLTAEAAACGLRDGVHVG